MSKKEFKQDLPYFFDILSTDSDKLLYVHYFEKALNNADSDVLSGNHPHSVWRDKAKDYGGN